MRESIMTGKTVEEATQLALAELGIAEEEATVEVLELPQRKLFRTIPAKVRVWVDEPEENPQAAPAPQQAPAQPVSVEGNARLEAACEYIKAVAKAMHAEALSFSAERPAKPPF